MQLFSSLESQVAKQLNLEAWVIGSYAAIGLQEKGLSSTFPEGTSAALLQRDPLLKKADNAFKPAFYTRNKLLVLPETAWTVQAVGGGAGKGGGSLAKDQPAGGRNQEGKQQQKKQTGDKQTQQQQGQQAGMEEDGVMGSEDEGEEEEEQEEPEWLGQLVQRLRASSDVQTAAVLGYSSNADPAAAAGSVLDAGSAGQLRIVSVTEQVAYCYVVVLSSR